MYGPGDNFDPKSSHVIAAIIRKVYEAQKEGKIILKLGEQASQLANFFMQKTARKGLFWQPKNMINQSR